MAEAEGEDGVAFQQLFVGVGMGGSSIGRVCVEDVDVDNRMRERRCKSAREVWELRRDARHEHCNEAAVLLGIE